MNKSNKHGDYKRPEITRNNDVLAKDQRRTLDLQRKRLEYAEKLAQSHLVGLVNSKIYSNIENNADFCLNYCKQEKVNLNNLQISSPLNNYKQELSFDQNCLDNCVQKKGESFRMLMNYFFAKMKLHDETKEDYDSLYDVPDKFKQPNI